MSCTLCGSSQHTAPHCKWRSTCTSCAHAEKPTSREMLKAGFVRCKRIEDAQRMGDMFGFNGTSASDLAPKQEALI